MVVQHNLSAMNTNRQMGVVTSALQKSTEKLSSGYKINRAGDDAAGLSISEKMRSQIRGLNKASDNAQDGISLIQVAEGALNETHSILQRMNELATQAANDTNTSVDRQSIKDEIEQLNEELDRIITEAKELGIHFFVLTGGEPMVRKKDILMLAEKHNDCAFHIFTNGTLIDEELCKEVQRLGNLSFALSVEGYAETNDDRRGQGVFEKVMHAMDLMKEHGLLFGTSICYTRANIEAVTSDEFLRMISEKGARFGFYFHYMPVGNNAVLDLMPTMEQREYMIKRIREIRSPQCDIGFFPMDFQNDGEYVGGCIAGGRNYFHINSAGDAEPCVFIHFSNTNIHENSILEILQSPLFMAYHNGQPFNNNHLRPCPMLENPELLRKMVERAGAKSTDLQSPETAEHLCAKCDHYAEVWKKQADELWSESQAKKAAKKSTTC